MAEEAVTLVVDNTEITAEVEVREGGMVKKTPHPPNQTVLYTTTYLHTNSSDRRPPFSVRPGGVGGGWVFFFTITSSRTSASAVISVLSTTSLTASSATGSYAVPVVYPSEFLIPCPPLLSQFSLWDP